MKVAILIPTMNRLEFVERVVGYYDSLNSPHPIYIGDASGPETVARTVTILKRFTNVEVKYFTWEGLVGNVTLLKLAEIARRECQFCVYSGDDDFLIPSSVTSCAEFLAENKGYRTAQGRAAIIELNQSGAYGDIRGLEQYWGANSLEQNTSLERLEQFSKKYYVMEFSVHRIEEYLDDSEYFLKVKNQLLGEAMHCHTFAIKGKSKLIDCLYLVRNVSADRKASGLLDWVMSPDWSSDTHTSIDGLSIAMHEASDLSLEQSRKKIIEIYKNLVNSWINKFSKKKESVPFLAGVKRLLPDGLKKLLRQLSTLVMDESDMRLLQSKRSRFYDEFQPVCESLNKRYPVDDRPVN
jgi:glycosyltransferase domain-containing protein